MDFTTKNKEYIESYAELIIADFARDKAAYDFQLAMIKLREAVNGDSNQ